MAGKISEIATSLAPLQGTDRFEGTRDPTGTPSSGYGDLNMVAAFLKADAAAIRAGTPDKFVTADGIESAAEFVALTDGANIALDWSTGLGFTVTLGGNRTLDNPTNGKPGTWRTIIVTQDGTGSRTLAFGNQYFFPGGSAPTLTTGANAEDVLSILCVTATKFFVFSALDLS